VITSDVEDLQIAHDISKYHYHDYCSMFFLQQILKLSISYHYHYSAHQLEKSQVSILKYHHKVIEFGLGGLR
jgi:hypothetical protein